MAELDWHAGRAGLPGLTALDADTAGEEIDHVALRAWRLDGLKAPLTLPVAVTYVAGPTDFRESALEGPACHVRITFETQ